MVIVVVVALFVRGCDLFSQLFSQSVIQSVSQSLSHLISQSVVSYLSVVH